jgi:lysosomal alpha-mannosidase
MKFIQGFCFDVCCEDNPVMDDPRLEDYNVDQMVSKFVDAILQEQSYSKGNHIMLKMGSDFHYAAANMWYKNLDKIIKHVNENDDRFHLFYSNPTKYTDARAEEGLTWSVKLDDFFPYADCEHCYWGGYFTSRPTLKYIERSASSFLQVLKQFSSFEKSHSKESIQTLFDFTAAVGLVNHHDAITGTSKQHVADDYTKILDKAFTAAEKLVSEKVSSAVFVAGSNLKLDVCRSSYNESTCSISQSIKEGTDIAVVVYNALPRKNTQQVTVFLPEIPSSSYVSVMEISSTGEMNDIPLGNLFLSFFV